MLTLVDRPFSTGSLSKRLFAMKSHLIRPLLLGVFAFPLFVTGQVERPGDPGDNFSSNVPINELSTKAYRRFHRRFRDVSTGEYWFKYEDGYKVSFTVDRHHSFAYFNTSGICLYSVRYYGARELSADLREFVKRRFPDYGVDMVTEVNDGQKTFYVLQIMNPDHIKVITIADGRVDTVRELTNGSGKIGPGV